LSTNWERVLLLSWYNLSSCPEPGSHGRECRKILIVVVEKDKMQSDKSGTKTGLFPNRIGWCIKKYGYTYRELADEIGISRKALYNYVSGYTAAPKYTLEKIAKTLGCSVKELIAAPATGAEQATVMSPVQSESSLSYDESFECSIATDEHQKMLPAISLPLQSIIEENNQLEGQDMDQLRRQATWQIVNIAGAAFFMPDALSLTSDVAERLSRVLGKSSHVDERTIFYLKKRVEGYWQDRNAVTISTQDLLPYVVEDLQKSTDLLSMSLSPKLRADLCSIAGIAAMLIGELFYDLGSYGQARIFHETAITAAREANNVTLEAVVWGRKSFAWSYDHNPEQALNCVQRARTLANSANTIIRTWLAAVEAEIQANLNDRESCLKALRDITYVEDQSSHREECYWIHFDPSLAAGYHGVSFLRLAGFGHRDLIDNAQEALIDALNSLAPSMRRRQPTLLIDFSSTHVRQENIEQACDYALQAMSATTQIQSRVIVLRLLALRKDLEPWKEISYVKNLDKQLTSLVTRGRS